MSQVPTEQDQRDDALRVSAALHEAHQEITLLRAEIHTLRAEIASPYAVDAATDIAQHEAMQTWLATAARDADDLADALDAALTRGGPHIGTDRRAVHRDALRATAALYGGVYNAAVCLDEHPTHAAVTALRDAAEAASDLFILRGGPANVEVTTLRAVVRRLLDARDAPK